MQYSVKVNGQFVQPIEAPDATAAVDAARAAHKPPEHGGDFDFEVADPSGAVVSSFSARHEPADHLRQAIDDAREQERLTEAVAAHRAAIKVELRAEVEAELRAEMSIERASK